MNMNLHSFLGKCVVKREGPSSLKLQPMYVSGKILSDWRKIAPKTEGAVINWVLEDYFT